MLRVRCSAVELGRWSEAAAAAGLTLSELVRLALEEKVRRRPEKRDDMPSVESFDRFLEQLQARVTNL